MNDLQDRDIEKEKNSLLEKIKDEDDDIDGPPPEDTMNVSYIIFLLSGIGTLLPWNSVLSAMAFFE